jgi:hypothetical protein
MRPIAFALGALAGTLFATQAFAQITSWSDSRGSSADPRDVHVTVFGAFAQPEGDFGAMSPSTAGFAKRSAGLGLDFSARFQHDFETGAMILIHRNATNTDALGKSIGAYYFANGYPGAPPAVSSKEWTLTWVLVKAGFAPQVGKRARVFVDVYGGALYGVNPEFKLVASSCPSSMTARLGSGGPRALARDFAGKITSRSGCCTYRVRPGARAEDPSFASRSRPCTPRWGTHSGTEGPSGRERPAPLAMCSEGASARC